MPNLTSVVVEGSPIHLLGPGLTKMVTDYDPESGRAILETGAEIFASDDTQARTSFIVEEMAKMLQPISTPNGTLDPFHYIASVEIQTKNGDRIAILEQPESETHSLEDTDDVTIMLDLINEAEWAEDSGFAPPSDQ